MPEYTAAAGLAGELLVALCPQLLDPRERCGYRVGVYLGIGRRPRSERLEVLYVGQADRRACGDMSDRYRCHRGPDGAPLFSAVAVIPLAWMVTSEQLSRVEGRVGRFFGRPPASLRLPATHGRPDANHSF